jgi:hypothetical protein
MTNITELVKRLREISPAYNVRTEAADALEAQAKAIAEKDARIAELEAASKAYADVRKPALR